MARKSNWFSSNFCQRVVIRVFSMNLTSSLFPPLSLFKKYLLSKLISSKEQQCIVFPLCGKTLDMKAILDLGHRVIGMEVSQMAIEAFFHENKISYEIEENQCKVYSVNIKIKITKI